MKPTLFLALALATVTAHAQSLPQVSLDGFVQRKRSFAVVSTPIGTVTHLLGTKYSLEIDALGGYDIVSARATAGFTGVVPIKLADQVTLRAGLGDMLDERGRFSLKGAGLYFGIRITH